jgi:predicted TIM-barrel fold metal-dependent hydrolase
MPKAAQQLIISADSHVMEDPDLWLRQLPAQFKGQAPVFPTFEKGRGFQGHEGGRDPKARVDEMAVDGVSQEILYPTLALNLFGMTDPQLQEACFQVYNDWLVEYCQAAADRLFGIAAISTFNIDHAISELERTKELGLVGAEIWEVPPPEFGFTTSHYEAFWEAAQALKMPINLHILTGTSYPWPKKNPPPDRYLLTNFGRHANELVYQAANAISDLITSGVLERFPELRFVIVESEASWIPIVIGAYDRYAMRPNTDSSLTMKPSEYFLRNFYATFFNDPTLGVVLERWGAKNCMWSNDFPHPNSTWPNSRSVIEDHLGHLPPAVQHQLVAGNVTDLYGLPVPT